MGSSLNYMSKMERRVLKLFGDDAKSRLGDCLVRMSVFGSKVRGDSRETSDIDVLVIVRERSLRVMDQIAEITSDLNVEYGLSISPVVFSEQEYDVNAKMATLVGAGAIGIERVHGA